MHMFAVDSWHCISVSIPDLRGTGIVEEEWGLVCALAHTHTGFWSSRLRSVRHPGCDCLLLSSPCSHAGCQAGLGVAWHVMCTAWRAFALWGADGKYVVMRAFLIGWAGNVGVPGACWGCLPNAARESCR